MEYNYTIIHIIVFEFLSKSWASDVSLWKFAPLPIYLFIPKFSWWNLYLRSSSKPLQKRRVFLWESKAQTHGELIYSAHQCFISPQTSHFHCLLVPVSPWLNFCLCFFYEHFYASGKLLWNIFSTCLAVVLYLPVFCAIFHFPHFWQLSFLFLIAFPTLLLNFFAFKNSFRVFIKECYILSWSLYHIFKLLPEYLKAFYPFSFSTYFLMQFSSVNFRWYYESRPLHATVEN